MSLGVTSVVLCALALLDGLLCGFRAAAGRDGRIDKRRYYQAALARGVLASALSTAACVGVALLLLALAHDRARLAASYAAAGRRALIVYVPYGAVAVTAICAWLVSAGGRVLATVIILGPFTMARPAVVVAGLAAAVFPDPRPALLVVGGCAALAALTLERRLLGRYPIDRALLDP